MSRNPLVDVRDDEDSHEAYLDGRLERPSTPVRRGSGTGEGVRQMYVPGRCWCGGAQNHDWPGRDEGAPHPR